MLDTDPDPKHKKNIFETVPIAKLAVCSRHDKQNPNSEGQILFLILILTSLI
jgi:hypothetical protein